MVRTSLLLAGSVCVAAVASPPNPWPAATVALDEAGQIKMGWNRGKYHYKFTFTADFGNCNCTPGYLSVGFAPSDKMAHGTYIMGYNLADGQGCVRSLTNGETPGDLPVAAGLGLDQTSITMENSKMTFRARAPISSMKPSLTGGHMVLFAAGSDAIVPEACDSELAVTNHHDLGDKGFVGSKEVRVWPVAIEAGSIVV